MIIEDEHDESLDDEYDALEMSPPIQVSREPTLFFNESIHHHHMIQSFVVHHALHNDIIEHFWLRQKEQDWLHTSL